MPSPFPGVDPFIESQDWEDFHSRFIQGVSDALVPRVRPRYIVRVERRVYVEHEVEAAEAIRPGLALLGTGAEDLRQPAKAVVREAVVREAVVPVVCTLPVPQEVSEPFLTIRNREDLEVVTVLEVLSPDNKRRGSDGRREYLRKREAILQSRAHLIELDFLRGGVRLPMVDPLPPGDSYAVLSRAAERPKAEVYAWTLRQPLPTILIPLAHKDPDVSLDLRAVYDGVYDRAGYDYSLDYRRPIEPALSEADAAWAQEVLQRRT